MKTITAGLAALLLREVTASPSAPPDVAIRYGRALTVEENRAESQ